MSTKTSAELTLFDRLSRLTSRQEPALAVRPRAVRYAARESARRSILGPAIRFFNRHRVTDEKGKVLGYKDLDLLRENLKPVLLRRTRIEWGRRTRFRSIFS